MIWPVSSYFLAWALTMFPKKHFQRLKSFQPQKNTARMLSLVQPQPLQHNVSAQYKHCLAKPSHTDLELGTLERVYNIKFRKKAQGAMKK